MELQADAKHEEDDADLGELLGHRAVSGEPGRVRSDDHAREQISDDRRQTKPLRDVTEDESRGETAGGGQDEVSAVHVGDAEDMRSAEKTGDDRPRLFSVFSTSFSTSSASRRLYFPLSCVSRIKENLARSAKRRPGSSSRRRRRSPARASRRCSTPSRGGNVSHGIVPIENSIGGSIHRNYDLLLEHELPIVGEVELKVEHALLAMPGVALESVKRVYSHPQALAQCERFLQSLPGIEVVATYDTAGSAKMIRDGGVKDAAAIASARAAAIFDWKSCDPGSRTTKPTSPASC